MIMTRMDTGMPVCTHSLAGSARRTEFEFCFALLSSHSKGNPHRVFILQQGGGCSMLALCLIPP
jgi:hypothetical protein